jgi:hypothetical protein
MAATAGGLPRITATFAPRSCLRAPHFGGGRTLCFGDRKPPVARAVLHSPTLAINHPLLPLVAALPAKPKRPSRRAARAKRRAKAGSTSATGNAAARPGEPRRRAWRRGPWTGRARGRRSNGQKGRCALVHDEPIRPFYEGPAMPLGVDNLAARLPHRSDERTRPSSRRKKAQTWILFTFGSRADIN